MIKRMTALISVIAVFTFSGIEISHPISNESAEVSILNAYISLIDSFGYSPGGEPDYDDAFAGAFYAAAQGFGVRTW